MSDLRQLLEGNPCDDENVREKARSLYENFWTEVEDTINDIAYDSYGPFIVTVFTLLAQIAVNTALNFASFVASSILGNFVGGVLSLLSLSLSFVNGISIMLKYLAATALARFLRFRIEFARSLRSEVVDLLNTLQALEDLGENSKDVILQDVESALPFVKRAAQIVGRENSKVLAASPLSIESLSSASTASNAALRQAVDQIDLALQALAGNTQVSPALNDRLDRLNRKYGITFKSLIEPGATVTIPSPLAVIEYFKDTTELIKEQYVDESGRGLTPEGRSVLQAYLIDFLRDPEVNDYLRNYVSTLFLKERVDSLGERLPIKTVALKNLGKNAAEDILSTKPLSGVNDVIDKATNPIDKIAEWRDEARSAINSVFEFLNIGRRRRLVAYPDENSTFASASGSVKVGEASILLQDEWLDLLKAETNVVKLFLTPALNKLVGVRRGMESTLNNVDTVTQKDITRSKFGWASDLSVAKTLIRSSTESLVTFGSVRAVDPQAIEKNFQVALDQYERLRDFIENRRIEETAPNQIERVIPESDRILNIADQYLSTFFLGPLALFNPTARGRAIRALQSIRILIDEMIDNDRQELGLCDQFISTVERNPVFSQLILPSWNAFIEQVEDIPILGGAISEIKRGNLSSIINSIGTAKYLVDETEELLDCQRKRNVGTQTEQQVENIAKAIGGDIEQTKQYVSEAKLAINRLKNKKVILESITRDVA